MRAWATAAGASTASILLVPAQGCVGRFLQTLAEFPPRQKPASFNMQGVLDKLMSPPQGVN